MVDVNRFLKELEALSKVLVTARSVLITAPGAADGDSLGAQLALRRMLMHRYPKLVIRIVNDEVIPDRYLFLPDIDHVLTPETYAKLGRPETFDIGFIVDGGIDRAGRTRPMFESCKTTVFIDHHVVSCDFPYTIRMVEGSASSTTQLIYHLSQTRYFETPVDKEFSQHIYLGLIFDTGFFRHSNTTAEAMELAAQLLRSGFDFTRVGERGMLERSFSSLKLLSDTLSRAELAAGGKIIWSTLSQEKLSEFSARGDDREGIIDHLFLTHGIEVAVLFFELTDGGTKVSLRSQGDVDVAKFARSLTEQGGGHKKAAGANFQKSLKVVVPWVLSELELLLEKGPRRAQA